MEFQDELAGGTVLVRPALQSPDYTVGGTTGWSINQDGSAEFRDLLVRGDGTGDIIIVGPATGGQVIIGSNPTNGYIKFPTNSTVEDTEARIVSVDYNPGQPNERLALEIQGPANTVNGDRLVAQLNAALTDGSQQPNFQIFDAATQDLVLVATKDLFSIRETAQIIPETASASSALFINAAAGHTGNLIRAQINGVDQFTADAGGVLTTYAANAFTTYTPTVNGGGTATFTTRTGWWVRIGKMIFFNAYFVVNAAGSGGATVTITAPTAIDRTTQQNVTLHSSGVFVAGVGTGTAVALTTGTGATFDGLRTSNNGANNIDATIGGANLLAGSSVSITGWYREA